jgi:LysR family glycine cleavage system transcriptional activator|tara:strand:+ start:1110 stop:2030 length:921 start_codon:yes stop_codon:yes gene_type:complete
MTNDRLPSLKALRVFEAVARRLSFRQAAEELNVTHSAVSHQVRLLEEQSGLELIDRGARQIALTPAGTALLPFVSDALTRLRIGIKSAKALSSDSRELTLHVYITVAMHWLLPRLEAFQRRSPDIKVRISTSYKGWEFDREAADLGLLYLRQTLPDLHVEPLCDAYLYPVCSPDYWDSLPADFSPRDLRADQLLEVYTAPEDWTRWLGESGATELAHGPAPKGRQGFDSYLLAQEAALEGRGFALCNGPFAVETFYSGRLIRPFKLIARQAPGWCLVAKYTDAERPKIQAFASWIRDELTEDPNFW